VRLRAARAALEQRAAFVLAATGRPTLAPRRDAVDTICQLLESVPNGLHDLLAATQKVLRGSLRTAARTRGDARRGRERRRRRTVRRTAIRCCPANPTAPLRRR
jgi:hypothetical protein